MRKSYRRLITACLLIISFIIFCGIDGCNHVYVIEIATMYDYEFPNDIYNPSYEFDLLLITDSTVNKVEFLTPAGKVFSFEAEYVETVVADGWITTGREDEGGGRFEWYFETERLNLSSLDDYGDGDYVITVYYTNGSSEDTTVWFGIPATNNPIAQPTQKPVFTSFSHNDKLSSPVTFNWQSCTDTAAELIWIGLENYNTGEEKEEILDVSATGLDGPLNLNTGFWK